VARIGGEDSAGSCALQYFCGADAGLIRPAVPGQAFAARRSRFVQPSRRWSLSPMCTHLVTARVAEFLGQARRANILGDETRRFVCSVHRGSGHGKGSTS
jgi:hypothetical protein